jgi:thiol-disulfide isomerase/thioredoxin
MRLGGVGLLAAFVALTGCKGPAPKPFEKKEPATPVSRAKGATPAWLEESMAKLPGQNTGIPKAGSFTDPKTPGFDPQRESRGLIAGRVLDPFGQGAKNVFIRIEPADASPKEKDGAAIGILTNEAGYFLVKDLPPGRAYTLTAEAKADGKPLYGMVQTRPPQSNVTIALRDDLALPPADGPPGAATAALPPGGDHIPSTTLPMPAPAARVGDGGWSPGVGSSPGSVPATIPGIAPSAPPSGGIPPPSGVIPSIDPRPSVRPESTAGIEQPWKPPTVSIPGGPSVPNFPLPPPNPPASGQPEKKSSRTRGGDITLVDSLERPWSLADRSGSLVLLEFMTTNCVHCKRTIPTLTELQSRYASSGLELIGVLCDDVPQRQRAALAAKYQRDHNLNYAVYVEQGPESGTVRDKFQVEAYPAVVLLSGDGSVLWQGHPAKKAELEAAIRRNLGR